MKGIRSTALAILSIALIGTVGLVLASSSSVDAAPFVGWALTPYLLLLYVMHQARNSNPGTWIASIGAIIGCAIGLCLYLKGMYGQSERADAQGALVFAFVPASQCVLALLVGGIWSITSRVTRSRTP